MLDLEVKQMKTETKSFAEYKAPGCKVVALSLGSSYLQATSGYGEEGKPGTQGGYYEDGDDY